MTNFLRSMVLSVAAVGLLAAQAPVSAPQAGRRAAAQMRKRGAVRQKLLAGYLGLTDAQQAQIKTIRDSARQAALPLRQQLKQTRADLRTAIQAGKPVDQLASSEGALMGKLIAIRANAREQMRGVLTPTQIQKLQDLRKQNG